MDKAKRALGNRIMVISAVVIILVVAGIATLGQRMWSQQEQLTTEFETCMEQAAFKKSTNKPDPARKLSPKDLERHFVTFEKIFKDTGLPPIWDGEQLIPWKIYHKESIIIASQCHKKLGIINPKKQLRGTYSKAIWDPNSQIWHNHQN